MSFFLGILTSVSFKHCPSAGYHYALLCKANESADKLKNKLIFKESNFML